jgi:molecular chaperone DnaJ
MSKRDYYDILGVEKNADDKAIKAAFRKLAMTNHPDRNQGDNAAEDRFREANEAYDILKDPQKRAAYDRMGHAAFDQSSVGGGGFGGGGFSDIFDQMFSEFSGGSSGRQRNQGGNDLRYDMSISLEDAFTGLQQDISITVPSECDGCSGSGAADGSKPSTCGTCGGAGRVRAQQGFFRCRTHMSCLPGHGPGYFRPLPDLWR